MFRKLKLFLILIITILFPQFFISAETLDLQIGARTDDVQYKISPTETLETWNSILQIGSFDGSYKGYGAGFRFTNVTIPQGSTIDAAYLTFRATSTVGIASVVRTKIQGESSDNANTFSDLTNYKARPRTTAVVAWNDIPAWAADLDYQSTSVVPIIQEIVSRPGWISGNSLVIFWEDKEMLSTVGAMRRTYDYYGNPLYASKLHIGYTAATSSDNVSPVLSNGSPSGTLAASTTGTTISVTATDSTTPITCRYSTTAGTSFSIMTGTMTNTSGSTYSANITGLTNGTTYNYYIRCQDSAGNANNDDFLISFSVATPAPPDTTPPVISGVAASSITTSSATISWTTDDQSSSVVNYGLTASFGSTQSSASLVTSHSINLASLTSNTTYYYQTRSCNSDNYCSNSTTQTFITLAPPTVGATTVGTLTLVPAFENISVYSSFSGDTNSNNQAVLEYREVGTSQWKPGIPMTVDRRSQVTIFQEGVGTAYINNPWNNQWRAVIFWLQPNKNYEVRVSYTDPDGVAGSPATATILTRNDNPSSSGTTYYVSTTGNDANNGLTTATAFRTVQKAANIVNPGDKVLVMPGTYNEQVIITRSGTENSYISFQSYDLNNKAVVDGQSSLPANFRINGANYIKIKGFELKDTSNPGNPDANIRLLSADNIIIEDNSMFTPGVDWADGGILVSEPGNPSNNILIQRNNITATNSTRPADKHGIYFWNTEGTGHVIRNNTFTANPVNGGFKDCIGGTPNGGTATGGVVGRDTYIYNNNCSGSYDDGFEVEGADINVAIWSNTFINRRTDNFGYMCLGMAAVTVGPFYFFRNTCVGTTDSAVKMGSSSGGAAYLYHNTIYSNTSNAIAHFGSDNKVDNVVFRNNIFRAGARIIYAYAYPTNNSFDYDNMFTTATYFARWYDAATPEGRIENPNGFAKFQNWTCQTNSLGQSSGCQEAHGIGDNPTAAFVNIVNNDFRLQSTSPNIDKGVVLLGFNDSNSPWPYKGLAPDIGAYEYDSGSPPPSIVGDISGPTSGVPDGKVNIYDVSYLLSRWGSTNPTDLLKCDINPGPGNVSQNKIDLYDANKMMANWTT